MAPRTRYPSDEKRLKTPPHVKIPLTVNSDDETAAVWDDLELRGMLVELWRLAAVAFAGRKGGRVVLSAAAVRSVTGRERHVAGVSRLRTLCSRMRYELVTDGSTCAVTMPNFSKDQGFNSAASGATPRTTSASDSDSDSDSSLPSEEKPKPIKKSAARRSSAAKPPAAAAGKPNPVPQAIAAFCEEHKAARGWNPIVAPKDKVRLGEAFADAGEEDFRGALRLFFAMDDEWIKENSYSSGAFLGVVGKCVTRVRGRARFQRPAVQAQLPPKPPDPAVEAAKDEFVLSLFAGGGKL